MSRQTLSGMVEACAHNRNVAERQLRAAEQDIERAAPGEVTDEMRYRRSRYRAEFEHWANYVGWYRQRIAREGSEREVDLGAFGSRTPRRPQAAQPQHDPRLPREREVGEDDGDELVQG